MRLYYILLTLFTFQQLAGYEMWAWGLNDSGQLGNGTTTEAKTPVLIAPDVTTASAGVNHTLFVRTDGSTWATGSNSDGQLGNSSTVDSSSPVEVALTESAVAVSAGYQHSLVLTDEGELYGFGSNIYGQLGLGEETTEALSPVLIDTEVKAVAAGIYHTLYLKNDDTLWGVGSNYYGELGQGEVELIFTPVMITSSVKDFSTGAGGLFSQGWYPAPYTLYQTTDNSLWGMGSSYTGQLGVMQGFGSTDGRVLAPIQLADNVQSFSSNSHTAYTDAEGDLTLLGRNADGINRYQGVNYFFDGFSNEAITINSTAAISALIAGAYHVYALGANGSLHAYNNNGFKHSDGVASDLIATNVVELLVSPGGWTAGFTYTELRTGHAILLTEPGSFTPWQEIGVQSQAATLEVVPPQEIDIAMNLSSTADSARLDWFSGTLENPQSIVLGEATLDLSVDPFENEDYFLRVITYQGAIYAGGPEITINHDYQAWCDAYQLSGTDRAEDADPDKDSINNALEHQLLSNPTENNLLPILIGVNADDPWVEFWIRDDGSTPPACGLSSDLQSWLYDTTVTEVPYNGETLRKRYRVSWEIATDHKSQPLYVQLKSAQE